MRTDVVSRPELRYGSVEYTATADYCKVCSSVGRREYLSLVGSMVCVLVGRQLAVVIHVYWCVCV